jgi:Protein of unknown function (DUF1501)
MTGDFKNVALARRSFLKTGLGLGSLALAQLRQRNLYGAETGVTIKSHGMITAPQFPPTAKRIISIHMLGAVSQVDSFDYKPMLEKMQGQEIPPSIRAKGRLSTMSAAQSSFPILEPGSAVYFPTPQRSSTTYASSKPCVRIM